MAALSGFLMLIAALIFGGEAMAADRENTLYMDVLAGRVVIEMRPDLAPAIRRANQRAVSSLAPTSFAPSMPRISVC
jgi:hypothetical protein